MIVVFKKMWNWSLQNPFAMMRVRNSFTLVADWHRNHGENHCRDLSIITRVSSILITIQITSNSYKDMDPDKAIEDFKQRIKEYEKIYEPLDYTDDNLSEQ